MFNIFMQEEWIFEFNVHYDILWCDNYGFVTPKTLSIVLRCFRVAVCLCMYVCMYVCV